jgi:leucyl/phenylalanyl-tRNA--protein transferase
MTISWLSHVQIDDFPPLEQAYDNGLLAAGGDLSSKRLIAAYQRGIFPWFNEGDPILWWSPDPRMVLFPHEIKVSKSLKKTIKHSSLIITIDTAFTEVIKACANKRSYQTESEGEHTWIHPDMIAAYSELHQQGLAHSIECWQDDQLVGGLYGVAMGKIFYGESMFSRQRDSSKIALLALCQRLHQYDFPIIDCQVHSEHLASLGAEEIDRQTFCQYLDKYSQQNVPQDCWQLNCNASALL